MPLGLGVAPIVSTSSKIGPGKSETPAGPDQPVDLVSDHDALRPLRADLAARCVTWPRIPKSWCTVSMSKGVVEVFGARQ
jgi:hypothetical protein